MAREYLEPGMRERLAGGSITAFLAAQIDLDNGSLYLADTPFGVQWQGRTWQGLGGIASVEPIAETDQGAQGLRFTIPLVSPAAISNAMNERVQGRPVVLSLVLVDDITLSDPLVWRGTMDVAVIEGLYTSTPMLSITAEHDMLAWNSPRGWRASHDDHTQQYPADTYYLNTAQAVQQSLIWPAATWYTRNL